MLGPEGVNEAKKLEEGTFGPEQLVWGLHMNTVVEKVRLPDVKVGKIQVMMKEPTWDHGNTKVGVHQVQVLTGNLQYASIPCPALLPELGAMYRLLRSTCGANVVVSGTEEEVAQVWSEFWEANEFVRLVTDVPRMWETHFTTGFTAMLTPRERLAMPGIHRNMIWAGGDSTLERIGVADWTSKVFGMIDVQVAIRALTPLAGDITDREIIIGVAEFLCTVLLAASQAGAWTGRVVVYASDNTNTEC